MGLFSRKSSDKTDEKITKDQEVLTETAKPKKKSLLKKIASSKSDESETEEKEIKSKKQTLMGRLMSETKNPPSIGDLVEGSVIDIDKAAVYIDLVPYGTGIIYGKEFIAAREIIKKINLGDIIAAKIVDTAHDEGYWELSLKEARQAIVWGEAESAIANKTIFELPIKEANKGGLILDWQGIVGFLPASQLKPENYPRVEDGDKDRILEALKKLVGTKLAVSIIGANPKEGKLIFSEKNPEQQSKGEIVEKYQVGDVIDGEITGVVDFGVFVKVEDGLEGLVHISEMDWALVENPKLLYKVADKVKVKVIEVKDGKISLSIKALKANPWVEASKKYKKDQVVKAVVIKFNKHGALASIEEGVAGLVHVSEFGSEDKLRAKLELGKTYPFKITLFDAKEQKMALSFVETTV